MKEEQLYKNLEKQLSITDRLALQRNRLAAERTMLAYIRTFLSFIVAGVSLIQFFNNQLFIDLGYLLFFISFIILASGTWRYYVVRKRLLRIYKESKL